MSYFFYDILLFLAALIYLPFYALRGRLHPAILTRLGFFKADDFRVVRDKEVVWIHAVSVGEARAAESLVRLIRQEWPKKHIAISTVTPTGHAIVRKFLEEGEVAFYAPLDISFVVAKFLRSLRPSLLVIMETEIWPNLIRLSRASGCRVVVVNGRVSDRSLKGYKKMKGFIGPVLKKVDLFCMQTEEAAARVEALGVAAEKIRTTGNIKFDISIDLRESPAMVRLKKTLEDSFLIIAGSTHENEEEQVIGIYKSLSKDFSHLRLLIAPRHLERLEKIKRLVRLNGLEAVYFSRMGSFTAAQVVLLDTIGDLSCLYRLAGVVFVGGSLVHKGGHNPIEPALFAKPVIFGKHMDNFKEVRDIFIRANAAIEVQDSAGLEYALRRLLVDPGKQTALGKEAQLLLDKNKGAAQRTFSLLRELVKNDRP